MKRTAALSKQSIKKPAPRKASKVVPIPEVAVVSDSDLDDTLGVSQSKLQEYKDIWAVAKEGNIAASYVAVSPDNFESFRLYVKNRFYRLIIVVCAVSQATKITHASFAKANLAASSAPTTTRDVPCSKVRASHQPRSVNRPTPVLPSNSPPQVSVRTLSFFGLY